MVNSSTVTGVIATDPPLVPGQRSVASLLMVVVLMEVQPAEFVQLSGQGSPRLPSLRRDRYRWWQPALKLRPKTHRSWRSPFRLGSRWTSSCLLAPWYVRIGYESV